MSATGTVDGLGHAWDTRPAEALPRKSQVTAALRSYWRRRCYAASHCLSQLTTRLPRAALEFVKNRHHVQFTWPGQRRSAKCIFALRNALLLSEVHSSIHLWAVAFGDSSCDRHIHCAIAVNFLRVLVSVLLCKWWRNPQRCLKHYFCIWLPRLRVERVCVCRVSGAVIAAFGSGKRKVMRGVWRLLKVLFCDTVLRIYPCK